MAACYRKTVLAVVLVLGCSCAFGAFRFAVVGDTRGSINGINLPIVQEIVAALITEAPVFVLVPGDLATDGTETQLRAWVDAFITPLQAAGIGVFPCRGNHDREVSTWNTVFSGALALPANGPAGEENLTYSFTYDNALFISLEQGPPIRSLTVNQAWLDEQLAGNTLPHVFAFGHYPAFAVGHADCLAVNAPARDAFWDSLALAGARVYFTGHDHFYDHARIPEPDGGWLDQYVVGSGGAPLRPWAGTYLDPIVQPISHAFNYGYQIVDVDGWDVTLVFKQRTPSGVYTVSDTASYSVEPPPPADMPAGTTRGIVLTAVVLALLAARFGLARSRREMP